MDAIKEIRTPCKVDADCPDRKFCYEVSKLCVDYVDCKRYNRFEAEQFSQDPRQCGPCMTGFSAEVLADNTSMPYCTKIAKSTESPEYVVNNALLITALATPFFCFIFLILALYITKRLRRNRNEINEEDPEMFYAQGEIRATAPPEDCYLPILSTDPKKVKYCLPHNNNRKVTDNKLVMARPFRSPNWVSNANFNSDDSNNDSTDGLAQQNISVSQSLAENNNLNTNNHSGSLTLGTSNLTAEHQDNDRNTALMRTQSLSPNANNADSTFTNCTTENKDECKSNGKKASKASINQINNITMKVNVINGRQY